MKKLMLAFAGLVMSTMISCSIFVSTKHHRAGVEVGAADNPNQKDSLSTNVKPAPGAVK